MKVSHSHRGSCTCVAEAGLCECCGKVEKKEEQQPTKVILANVAQDSRNEACSTAMVLRHILKLASAVSEALE